MSNVLKEQWIAAGQEHLFENWDSLTQEEQADFLTQLSQFEDPDQLVKTAHRLINYSADQGGDTRNFQPLPTNSHSSTISEPEESISNWRDHGLQLIHRGEVAVILMAGGQGSRLGSSRPKGCYDIGLPSHKSLFQIQAEKILKITALANARYPDQPLGKVRWYIMTSKATRDETVAYFDENNYFGLLRTDVIFFNQGTLPCFSADGSKILLESPGKICESPDGNGGLYRGIYTLKLLEDFEKHNIKHIHMYCVDNCLAKVADPVFIGWSALNQYQLSTKVVRKRNASESVGLIVLDADKQCPCVIEYSEISKELSEKTNDDGSLYLKAANIVNHYYSVDLLQSEIKRWISSPECLPFHVARKKIEHWDPATKEVITPSSPNGVKLEQFIFDIFPFIELSKFGCLEVERSEEFSPLKNGPGSANDCPETARRDSMSLQTRWVKSQGAILPPDAFVEVSVATSYAGEGLEFVKGQSFVLDQII